MVEVALIISSRLDAAEAEEDLWKGEAPKGSHTAMTVLGNGRNTSVTVILQEMGRYPKREF